MARALWLGLFAAVLLAGGVAPARADMPGPYPWSKRPERPLRYGGTQPDPAPEPAPQPAPPEGVPYRPSTGQPNPPKRTGPFRSCGSGMGTGLAGIGAAWAMLWLGNRFAGRVARRAKDDRTG